MKEGMAMVSDRLLFVAPFAQGAEPSTHFPVTRRICLNKRSEQAKGLHDLGAYWSRLGRRDLRECIGPALRAHHARETFRFLTIEHGTPRGHTDRRVSYIHARCHAARLRYLRRISSPMISRLLYE